MANKLLVILAIMGLAFAATPAITFISQTPADLNITNAINNPLKLNYTVTGADLNVSSIRLYYKANSTTDNTQFFLNGTAHAGFFEADPPNTSGSNYVWYLLDNAIYPGTFNTGPVTIDNKERNYYTLLMKAGL